ncbi:MAG TPA: pyruvate, phosphate dikinase, partial [Rhodospirillales bacterium]|nr:pyruvate, phosphate dikinase [Rhodospirillales bacterium]
FFDPVRIVSMREMILSSGEAGRRVALEKLLPYQREDFKKLFTIMRGLPVTIRLLDPPLHEFLPTKDEELEKVAQAAGTDVIEVRARVAALHETNPMLGLRGCRLGIMYPEIYEMQSRAIFEAAAEVEKVTGESVVTEVMIPLVASKEEFKILKDVVGVIAKEVEDAVGLSLNYLIGTMVELPRAALRAGEIAEEAEFFSFGTNDLTQTTFGLSRDDSGTFLDPYIQKGIFRNDPFVTIDQDGVGELLKIAAERGRASRTDLKLGICGEHGGDPESIKFCKMLGLNYVSCSPYRVPIARLACAQASLNIKEDIASA